MIPIDGKAVWALYATHGLPWEFILPGLASKEMVPTWKELVEAAEKDGTNLSRLGLRLNDAIGDSYPPDVAAEIRTRLLLLLEQYQDRDDQEAEKGSVAPVGATPGHTTEETEVHPIQEAEVPPPVQSPREE